EDRTVPTKLLQRPAHQVAKRQRLHQVTHPLSYHALLERRPVTPQGRQEHRPVSASLLQRNERNRTISRLLSGIRARIALVGCRRRSLQPAGNTPSRSQAPPRLSGPRRRAVTSYVTHQRASAVSSTLPA